MFTIYEVAKGIPGTNGSFPFGFDREKMLTELRKLVENLAGDDPAYMLQKLTILQTGSTEDFPMTEVTIAFFEKQPPVSSLKTIDDISSVVRATAPQTGVEQK